MKNDPIVEETRALRDELAREHNYDIAAIAAALRQAQERRGGSTIALAPKRVQAPARSTPSKTT